MSKDSKATAPREAATEAAEATPVTEATEATEAATEATEAATEATEAATEATPENPFGEFKPQPSPMWQTKETAKFRPEFLRMVEVLWRARRMIGTQLHCDGSYLTAPDEATARLWAAEFEAAGASIPNVSVQIKYAKEVKPDVKGEPQPTGRWEVHFRPRKRRGVDVDSVRPTIADIKANAAILTA